MFLQELLGRVDQSKLLRGGLPAGPSTPNADRAAGLAMLEARRRGGAAPAVLRDERGESYGCAMVMIPELDWEVIKRRFPELICKDADTRNKAWHKFFREFGSVYGVDDSVGKRKRNTGIIVR